MAPTKSVVNPTSKMSLASLDELAGMEPSVSWKALLRRGAAESGCGTGHLPFSQWGGELNEQNQRVIRADCDRTRAEHEFFRRGDVRAKMEAMLTCWCQQQQARYKQGLNEVLAPFLLLQSGPAAEAPTDDEVYLCFAAFLRRFAPFFFSLRL
ncbi:unnamed protein product [Prorocentrum cordatum]|uniref:Rab-GAP TBC domain-containing protein n=1 Tax=Prorocentrum cordatum TaxID=2364126 RepID=A0ABN9V180_9DINO|nr:unnamed protein product [Polarella glacialis]